MTILIGYDITDNKARKKISDYLIQIGMHRLQKSLFVGFIHLPRKHTIEAKINAIISEFGNPTDKLFSTMLYGNSLASMVLIDSTIAPEIIEELKGNLRVIIY